MHGNIAFALLLTLFSLANLTLVYSQDDDEYFDNKEQIDPVESEAPPAWPKYSFKVYSEALGGYTLGTKDQTYLDLWLAQMSIGASLELRPSDEAKFFASGEGRSPSSNGTDWTEWKLGELYTEFTIAETLYNRVGTFTEHWGQAYFYTPFDFTAGVEKGLGLRSNIALGSILITGFANYLDEDFDPNQSLNTDHLSAAARVDVPLGDLQASLGYGHKIDQNQTLLLSLKLSALGLDWYLESASVWDKYFEQKLVAGLFAEVFEKNLRIVGEYYLEFDQYSRYSQNLAMIVNFPKFVTHPSVGFKYDAGHQSGQVFAKISQDLFDVLHLELAGGFNFGSLYKLPGAGLSDPLKRQWYVGFLTKVRFDFLANETNSRK